MKKTQIIKEIVGKRIEPYGFQYLKTDNLCWIFIREVRGIKRYYDPENDVVKQYINIDESRFAKEIILRISTDAHVMESKISLEEQRKCGIEEWVEYTDEETYRKALSQLADIIVEHALALLERMSVEDEIIPTKAMNEKLIRKYKELDKMFVSEYHLKAVPEQMEGIDEWQRIIKKILLDIAEQPYGEVKELLVKMSAFIGERLCEICDMEWMPSTHSVIGGDPYRSLSPLVEVVKMWKEKCTGQGTFHFDTRCVESLKKAFLEKTGQKQPENRDEIQAVDPELIEMLQELFYKGRKR